MPIIGNPSEGGLDASNYPNPYGLRAYRNDDGSWGGQMMPKGTGWLGVMQNLAYPDTVSTELSSGDEKGDFPLMTPNLSPDQLHRLLLLKDGEKPPKDIYDTAKEFADARRAEKLNTFKDVGDTLDSHNEFFKQAINHLQEYLINLK